MLGATYASLFPHRVRALALDGAADPVVWTDEATGFLNAQAVGAQHEYKAFLAWCRANRSQCAFAAHGDPGAAIDRLLARLHANPVSVETTSGRRLLTERQAVTGIVAVLYSSRYWPLLGEVGDNLSGADGRLLLALSDAYTDRRPNGSYSNLLDAYVAISCVDHAPASREPGDLLRPDRALRADLARARRPARLRAAAVRVLAGQGGEPLHRPVHGARARRRSSSSARPATRRRRTSGPRRSPASSTRACS